MLALLLTVCVAACQPSGAQPAQVRFTLRGTITGQAPDSVKLVDLFMGQVRAIGASAVQSGAFTLQGSAPQPGIYLLVAANQPLGQVAVLDNRIIELAVNFNQGGPQLRFNNSPVNQDLAMYQDFQRGYQQTVMQINDAVRQGQLDQKKAALIADSLTREQQQMNANTARRKDILGTVAALYSYPRFGSDSTHRRYANEVDYFKRGFFSTSNLKDPNLATVPIFYDKVSAYANNLAQIALQSGTDARETVRWIDSLRRQVASSPRIDQGILYAAMGGTEQIDPDAFAYFGSELLRIHPSVPMSKEAKERIRILASLAKDQMPPDIVLSTPDGKVLKLSDLRGKVVLVDFWASWCGPCRRENPNVVKVYAKYRDRGFEIYGVSLDRERQSWLDAIAADGLTWKHVSDLKLWQSDAAKAWGVTAIPFAVLLDPEGRVIAKNLRGPALEAKLNDIFN